MKKNIVILIVAILVSGGAGFFGGMQYQKNSVKAQFSNNFFANGSQQKASATSGDSTASDVSSGQILSKTDSNLTIKLPGGGSQIIFIATSSKIMESATTTIDKLNVGQNIMVIGKSNIDGNITAKTVQIGDFNFTVRQTSRTKSTTSTSESTGQFSSNEGSGDMGGGMPPMMQ